MHLASKHRFLFMAIGTSGVVYPAASLVLQAHNFNAHTLLINAEPAQNASAFDTFIQGSSGHILPTLFKFN